MASIFADASMPRFPKLVSDIQTDVLVIGGGIAGILTAYALQSRGVDCVVAEAQTLCSGITHNTTAKITSQHGFIYDKLLRSFGIETAKLYLQANEDALARYRELCGSIECDFEEKDAFAYSLTDPRCVEKELRALQLLGYPAKFDKCSALPFSVVGGVRFARQAQFHPLRFLREIAKHLKVYEHSAVIELQNGVSKTEHGSIRAEHVVVATHFPFLNRHGSYFLKLYQQRSYVTAATGIAPIHGMYIDGNGALSLRDYRENLLIGSGGHHTGKTSSGWRDAEMLLRYHYPAAKITAQWATQDCMTLDSIPYIGQYSSRTERVYVATGFNKWGMTSAMVASMLLADRICQKENAYAALFSPSRSILTPQLVVNVYTAVTNLLRPTAPRCPHLGCALVWNKRERSWDCPCHGSRFSESGSLLDNPATKNLKRSPGRKKD